MNKVERLAEFPKNCLVAQFLGKGYDDAAHNAEEWQKNTGNTCHSYFEQKLITKWYSIIVHYTLKENENGTN